MSEPTTYEEFKAEADKIFKEQTGCGWDDLCGDEEPMQRAYAEEEETPRGFVLWYIRKFDLIVLDEVI